MSTGSSKPVVTTQNTTKDPWIAAQPALQTGINDAQSLYSADVGFNPFPGQTFADFDPRQLDAFQGAENIARSGDALGTNAYDQMNSLVSNQGLNSGLQDTAGIFKGVASAGGLGTDALYQDIYSRAGMPGQSQTALQDIAGNTSTQNPFLQSILDAQGAKIQDSVNSSMSGAGRVGSGAHTGVLTSKLAEAANPILYQDYADRQNRGMQAAGMLGSLRGQDLGTMMGAAGGLTQARNAGTQNTLNAGGQLSGLYSGGLGRVQSAAGMAPSLYDQLFSPSSHLGGIGDAFMQQDQNAINDLKNYWESAEARPWDQLGRLNAIASGAGMLGGTSASVGTAPNTAPSSAQQIAGLGLAGAGIFSKMAPFFSDRRLKRDVERVGTGAHGLPVYEWTYVWGGPRARGFMADDVRAVMPEAVTTINGFDAVYYDMLGEGA
jgi:hypothetical protein